MLGWRIICSTLTPKERDADKDRKEKNLATWETGVQGLQWLHRLVENGTVKEHSLTGGYPNRYTVLAGDLLPLFQEGPPLSPGIDGANRNVTLYRDRIAACPQDKYLTLEVWDQS